MLESYRDKNDFFFQFFNFLTKTSKQHKGRLLVVVSFFVYFRRVSSLSETSSGNDFFHVIVDRVENVITTEASDVKHYNLPQSEIDRIKRMLQGGCSTDVESDNDSPSDDEDQQSENGFCVYFLYR